MTNLIGGAGDQQNLEKNAGKTVWRDRNNGSCNDKVETSFMLWETYRSRLLFRVFL